MISLSMCSLMKNGLLCWVMQRQPISLQWLLILIALLVLKPINYWTNCDENPNVQARIVFTADNTDTDSKTPVVRHILALNALINKVKRTSHA